MLIAHRQFIELTITRLSIEILTCQLRVIVGQNRPEIPGLVTNLEMPFWQEGQL